MSCYSVSSLIAVLSFLILTSAGAQGSPNRPVGIIAPFPQGGGIDIVARTLAQKLSPALKQSVIVDNRAGADGMIGSELVARAAPDGYTPERFAAHIDAELVKWARIVKAAGVTPH